MLLCMPHDSSIVITVGKLCEHLSCVRDDGSSEEAATVIGRIRALNKMAKLVECQRCKVG